MLSDHYISTNLVLRRKFNRYNSAISVFSENYFSENGRGVPIDVMYMTAYRSDKSQTSTSEVFNMMSLMLKHGLDGFNSSTDKN